MQKKIKIGLMSYSMDNRSAKGTALYTRKLIEGLLGDSRFDFYLVHYNKVSDPLYQRANEIIMPKIKLPYGSKFISQLLFFWKYRKENFDIIHWFQPRIYPFYWLAPAKKIVVTMHGAGDITAPKNFVFSRIIFNFVLKYFHKWVDMAIVVSKNAKEEVVKYYNFSSNNVSYIYNGGGEDYKPYPKDEAKKIVAEKYGINEPYILDVSRLQPHKNVLTLIKGYNILRLNHPERMEKLVIVGSATDNKGVEYSLAKKSEFSKDIVFIDFVKKEDLNAMYSGAEIFVFPSLTEGFGLPILEAMASGTPVVTSNVTSMPEIGGNAVITVPPLDADRLALEMNKLLTDEVLRQELVSRGLNRVPYFTWSKMAEETKDLYIKLCKA